MNRFTRLTALLLALMMILSTFAAAETAYQVGDMTTEQWNSIVQNAQDSLKTIDPGQAGEKMPAESYVAPEHDSDYPYSQTITATIGDDASVSMTVTDKLLLSSSTKALWQIELPAVGLWADLSTGNSLSLTYALLKDALNNNVASIRQVTRTYDDEGKTVITEIGRIKVSIDTAVATFMTETRANEIAEDGTAAQDDNVYSLEVANADNTVSAVVNFWIPNRGTPAAQAWGATVPKGSELSADVPLPIVPGFEAKDVVYKLAGSEVTSLDGVTFNQPTETSNGSVALDIAELSDDITITVNYRPAEVQFRVDHYLQNVDNDNYTQEPSTYSYGLTDNPVGEGLALPKYTNNGFTALLYDTTTKIAADGSTYVEIYYDRDYYLVTFNLSGGWGVEPIYARYGTPMTIGTPVRPGYTFAGWTPALPATVTAAGEYTAQWTAEATSFTVAFWYEDANPNADGTYDYSYVGSTKITNVPAGTVVTSAQYANTAFEDRDDEHFTYNPARAEEKIVAGDGSTTLNIYYTRNSYTIYFRATGTCVLEEHSHTDACYTKTCSLAEHSHAASGCTLTNCDHTTHALSCWGLDEDDKLDAKPGRLSNVTNPVSGQIYTGKNNYEINDRYYLYYDGAWYCHHYRGNEYPTTQIVFACGHDHDDEGCYNCGLIDHTHSAVGGSCYTVTCGNVNGHRHTSSCTNANRTNVVKVVTRKYDADITDIWPIVDDHGVNYDGYDWESSVTGKLYAFLEKMPGQDITMTEDGNSGTKKTWYYYLEVLPGETYTVETRSPGDGRTYYYYLTSSAAGWSSLTYEEDYFPITGFTQRDSKVPAFENNTAYLYYTRNKHTLKFNNRGPIVQEFTGDTAVFFDAKLSAYGMVDGKVYEPPYPAGLEAGAYEFEGWYSTAEFVEGTKVDFTTARMPDADYEVFANWVPVKHNVKVYLTKEAAEADTTDTTLLLSDQNVSHNDFAIWNAGVPDNGQYKFEGWFYMDGDTEKGFDFESFPIKRDMEIYAKWKSDVMMPYTFRYAIKNADGTLTYIAQDTTGSALAGKTVTVDAKTGMELAEGYQTGYFPEVGSHSLTLDIEGNDENKKNEFTFIYIPATNVPYKVRYVDAETGVELETAKKVMDNSKAVVTEQFVPIAGMMPDAYQKRLVLSATGTDADNDGIWDENVITFYYVKSDKGMVIKTHYIQTLTGAFEEYSNVTDSNAEFGVEYTIEEKTIPGFTLDKDHKDNVVSGTLVKDSVTYLHLKLYYVRNSYPYEFRFVDVATGEEIADKVAATELYEATVYQAAKEIPGYTLSSASPESYTMTIQIEDPADVANKNVRTFYYTENQVEITYVPTPEEGGTLDNYRETIGASTGEPKGATATANPYYEFKGWYDNAEGVGNALTLSAKFVPEKTESEPWKSATYYAVFVEQTATITYIAVRKTGENEYTEDDTGGTVDVLDNATPAGAKDSETVTVVTGAVAGATAEPTRNYEFLGWFTKDDNGKYVAIENGSELEYLPVKGDIWQDATYYALFELDVADLTITKTVNGAPAGIAEQEFAITVSLPEKAGGYTYIKTLADKSTQQSALTTNGGTLNIKNGETIVIKDVAIGSQYSVTETEPSYFTVTGEVENAQIGNGENKVSLINTYKSGQLSIAKTVQAAENVDVSSAVFTFTVTLDPAVTGSFYYTVGNVQNSATFNNGVAEITLKDGETATFETLPNGVEYTVTEQLLAGYVLDENKTSNTVGKITNGTSASAVFTNIHRYGNLVISKTVSGEDAPGGEFVFNITLNDGALTKTYDGVEFKDGKAQVVLSVAKNETKTAAIIGLPAGTTYTVTEAVVPGYTTTITEATTTPGSIDPAGTDTVAFANEYKTGILTIKKMVATAAGVTAPKKDFAFIVTLKDTSGNALTGSYAYTIDNGGMSGSLRSGGTIKLKHGQTATFDKLPDGVTFEVKEAKDDDYVTTMTPTGTTVADGYVVSGMISADNAQAVEFTNFYNYGKLTITKMVKDAPDDLAKQEVFNVQISGLKDGTYPVEGSDRIDALAVSDSKGTLTIKHGETLIIKNIKDGTNVTVEETSVPTCFDATVSPSSVTIDAEETDSTANTVAITNTYKPGKLTISKTVVGTTAPADAEFSFTLTLKDVKDTPISGTFSYYKGNTSSTLYSLTLPNAENPLKLKANESVTFINLPVGVSYTVTEIENADYETEKTGDTGTITTDGTTAEFTNTYQYSDLKISKTVVNASKLYKGDVLTAVPFAFTVTLTVPDGASLNKLLVDSNGTIVGNTVRFTLKDRETATIKNIPVGTTYKVEETEVAGYTTKVSLNDGTADDATSANGKIVVNTVDTVAFTNTYSVGQLVVTKTVVDKSGMGYDLSKDEFTFTVTFGDTSKDYPYTKSDNTPGMIAGGTGTITLKKDETVTFDRIPAGVTYTVTETNLPTGYTQTSPVGEAEGTISSASATASVAAFTNTYNTGSLTITKNGMSSGEVAVFTAKVWVRGVEQNITVVVPNGSSTTINGLDLGSTYTVSEIGDWTWRYTSKVTSGTSNGKIPDTPNYNAAVTFENTKDNPYWLDGSAYADNRFGDTTTDNTGN